MIFKLTVRYVSGGALRLMQDSDQANPANDFQSFSSKVPNGALVTFTPAGVKASRDNIILPLQYHTGERGGFIPPRNLSGEWRLWKCGSCSSFFLFVSLDGRRVVGTIAPCRGTRTSKTERVEQKERITWSKKGLPAV